MARIARVIATLLVACGGRTGLAVETTSAPDSAVDVEVEVSVPDVASPEETLRPDSCRSDPLGNPIRTAASKTYRLEPASAALAEAEGIHAVIGDVTGDGRPDVVAVTGREVLVFPQNEDAALGAPLRISEPGRAVSLIDIAGRRAIIAATATGLSTFRVDGAALTPLGKTAAIGAELLAVADVDGDGLMDVVTANRASLIVTTYFGDGGGGFHRERTLRLIGPAREGVEGIALVDIDRDGSLELTVMTNGPFLGYYRRDTATGGWDFATGIGLPIPASYHTLVSADVDGDSRPDFVLGGRTLKLWGGAAIVQQEPSGRFALASWSPSPIPYTLAIAARDLDADGQVDVTASVLEEDTVHATLKRFFRRDGELVTESLTPLGEIRESAFGEIVVGDINCDGCPDVILNGTQLFLGRGCANSK